MSSPLDSSVTLGDALELIESRRIPIAPEVAGYLCLELAERALMQEGGLLPEGVFLGEEGSVAFVPRAEGEAPDRFVRTLLHRLLEVSASRPPALWQCSTSTRPGLEALVRELEAALIPLNRMASRRSLARLAREVKRVTQGVGRNAPSSVRKPPASVPPPAAKLPPAASPPRASTAPPPLSSAPPPPVAAAPPAPARQSAPSSPPAPIRSSAPPARISAIDELLNALDPVAPAAEAVAENDARWQLKAIAGLEPTPPPPNVAPEPESEPELAGDGADHPTDEESEAVEALLAAAVSGPQSRLAEAMRPSRPDLPHAARAAQVPAHFDPPPAERARSSAPPPPALADTQDELPPKSIERALRRSTPPGLRPRRSSGGGGTVAVTLLLAVLVTLGLVYWQRPEWMLGHKLPAPTASSSAPVPLAPARSCAIRVVGAPERTEILLLQGRAPLDVSPMPAGARIEFVGLLAGYAPKRAAVPAQSKWDPDPQGRPRYELAFELAPSHKKADPWPPTEPDTVVGGEGEPGTVRVVSSPRDAEVWLLFGSGPDAEIAPVPCAAHEVLVASGTSVRTRLKVAAEEFVSSGDGGPATVVLQGSPKPR